MTTQLVKLVDIRLDDDTQMREGLRPDVVAEYAERMLAGDVFPPVELFFDGSVYWPGDGHHRCHAALAAGRDELAAQVEPGGKHEAVKHACKANRNHGLQRTREGKRRAVGTMLREHAEWSDRQIGDWCGVDHKTVAAARGKLVSSGEIPTASARKTSDGRTVNVTALSASNASRASSDGTAAGTKEAAILDEICGIAEAVAAVDGDLRARRGRLAPLVACSAWHDETVARARADVVAALADLIAESKKLKARVE